MNTARRLLILLFLWGTLTAQQEMGHGFYEQQQDFPCLTDNQRAEIQQAIAANREMLRASGQLPQMPSGQVTLFDWPVAGASGQNDYGYHGISNFVDLDANYPNMLLDWNCLARTYDTANGYNHAGIDLFTWPFGWEAMDNDRVNVVAAAPGFILLRQDGNQDRSCSFNGTSWNAIYVEHADGSVAWYGHMKRNSLTPKGLGQPVVAGEYRGVVGSSGNSTGPHLHFEVHDSNGAVIEPYAGSCNTTTSDSWWNSQRPYRDSAINRLMTHFAPPVFPNCPQTETLNERNSVAPGERVYTAAYYRDQETGQLSQYRIKRPDGSIFNNWEHSSPQTYNASWWYWSSILPVTAPQGQWTFEVDFAGQTYAHSFTVGVTGIDDEARTAGGFRLQQNYPNPFNPSTRIEFFLPRSAQVSLKVYDNLGREVAVLVDAVRAAGEQAALWNGEIDGAAAPGGTYYYRLMAGDYQVTRAMQLVR